MTSRWTLRLSFRQVSALLIVYLVWGSTYLAIRFAIETLPTFTMAGVRFLIAGALLYGWGRWRGGPRATPREWRRMAAIGALLFLAGNGGVVWAEHQVPSGIAALLIAIEPAWIVLLSPLVIPATRLRLQSVLGVALGLAGVTILMLDPTGADPTRTEPLGALAIVGAAFTWALGSLLTTRRGLPTSRPIAFGGQMVCGGLLLLLLGAASGEWATLEVEQFSTRSLLALAYLIAFGSIVAISAYGYLLRTTAPIVAATYAFVNPVVAVGLGWLLADEPFTSRLALASAVILSAVALILRQEAAPQTKVELRGATAARAVDSRQEFG